MNDIAIRQAGPADRDAIVAANVALALESEQKVLNRETVRAGVAVQLADPAHGLYFLAEQGGDIIGQLALTWEWSDWRNGTFWWIQSVYVAAAHRGSGVFRKLYEYVAAEARRRDDVAGLRLYVDKDNRNAMAVYRRMGMSVAHYDMLEVDFTAEKPSV
ncbi:MAG TPA: GNAT family N-acetyltransferase [Gammaproteobacteria bacterium]|nr:GNAT family N-acetyltransferase [Gammaproteobacteria bacterium]